MNIKLGWSGEIHGTWTKLDIEVEENDFNLHFAEAGESVSDLEFSPLEKFKMMFLLAEIFVSLHKASKFPEYFNNETDKAERRKLIQSRDELTQKIISRKNDKPPF